MAYLHHVAFNICCSHSGSTGLAYIPVLFHLSQLLHKDHGRC